MLNQIVLVGRVKELPTIQESANGNKFANLLLELDRPFKNSNGVYEQDYITIILWKGIAETVSDICQINDIIGVKGRIQSYSYEGKDGQTYRSYDIIAEKISFLNKNHTETLNS